MKISSNRAQKKKDAYILVVTLAFLVVLLIVLGSTMGWMVSNSTMTARNNQFVSSGYAAESATEKVLGQMESDWLADTLNSNGSSYATLIPTNMTDWPVHYVFSDTNGVTNQISVNMGQKSATWQPLPSPYSGLKAYVQPVTVTATATPTGQRYNVAATVSQVFDISSVPIFQFLIFYNMNLEFCAADTMNINGPVFSNEGLWTGAPTITFNSTVWAVQSAVNGSSDPFVSYTGNGASKYSIRGQPVSGVNHITMPIAGTNDNPSAVEAILQWPPSSYALGSSAAYTTDGETYMPNWADLIISNSASGMMTTNPYPIGTNFFVYYQDQYYQSTAYNNNTNNWASAIIWMTNDFYIVSNVTKHAMVAGFTNYVPSCNWTNSGTNFVVWYAGYSFLTNVLFYDWREGWNGGNGYGGKGKSVYAVQFDVSKFNIWQTNTAVNGGGIFNNLCNSHNSHPIGKVYIWNSVPLTVTNLPAVRIVNGSKLPDSYGLSIATAQPLYVWGNFNTTEGGASDAATLGDVADSWPASFLADAITVLSSSWSDTTTSKAPNSSSSDTVNAACLEGIVPSNSSVTSTDNANYSGGVENFLRLLENWSGNDVYYNGSIVVMFPSQYATNRWLQTGNYYDAATREWSFDTNFETEAGLPPFTPQMKTTFRSTWTAN
ncbi:MAG TPA: hypothetical protein VMF08_05255 [Candidatus Sulfotelmatobacter sp.]|nr:hypothetical protein [Candidatus Sulfotelmatobacter sp.]